MGIELSKDSSLEISNNVEDLKTELRKRIAEHEKLLSELNSFTEKKFSKIDRRVNYAHEKINSNKKEIISSKEDLEKYKGITNKLIDYLKKASDTNAEEISLIKKECIKFNCFCKILLCLSGICVLYNIIEFILRLCGVI